MPNEDAVMLAEPDYKSEYKRLIDENRSLKEEVDSLHMTILRDAVFERGVRNG